MVWKFAITNCLRGKSLLESNHWSLPYFLCGTPLSLFAKKRSALPFSLPISQKSALPLTAPEEIFILIFFQKDARILYTNYKTDRDFCALIELEP